MSKKKSKKQNNTKSIIAGAVGTIFNIVVLVVAVMLIYKGSILAYNYGVRVFGEPAMSEAPGTEVEVTVYEGEDVKEVGQMLLDKGLIRDVTLFTIQEKVSSYKDSIQPGTYTVSTAMTTEEILRTLSGVVEEEE